MRIFLGNLLAPELYIQKIIFLIVKLYFEFKFKFKFNDKIQIIFNFSYLSIPSSTFFLKKEPFLVDGDGEA